MAEYDLQAPMSWSCQKASSEVATSAGGRYLAISASSSVAPGGTTPLVMTSLNNSFSRSMLRKISTSRVQVWKDRALGYPSTSVGAG